MVFTQVFSSEGQNFQRDGHEFFLKSENSDGYCNGVITVWKKMGSTNHKILNEAKISLQKANCNTKHFMANILY